MGKAFKEKANHKLESLTGLTTLRFILIIIPTSSEPHKNPLAVKTEAYRSGRQVSLLTSAPLSASISVAQRSGCCSKKMRPGKDGKHIDELQYLNLKN